MFLSIHRFQLTVHENPINQSINQQTVDLLAVRFCPGDASTQLRPIDGRGRRQEKKGKKSDKIHIFF